MQNAAGASSQTLLGSSQYSPTGKDGGERGRKGKGKEGGLERERDWDGKGDREGKEGRGKERRREREPREVACQHDP